MKKKIVDYLKVTKKIKKDQSRFIELDSLRGLAIIFILLSHFTWAYDYHFGTLDNQAFSFIFGPLGVQIFFVISGFGF